MDLWSIYEFTKINAVSPSAQFSQTAGLKCHMKQVVEVLMGVLVEEVVGRVGGDTLE